jgi:UDP-N-acetylmuramoyl-tripeptide--D-alanyl-D-alanine ligase
MGGLTDRGTGGRAWSSEQVAQALGVAAPEAAIYAAIGTDTRHLTPATLFVALRGERFDAHDFLAEARTRGATAAVVRQGTTPVPGLPLFEVPDTLAALGLLGRARRRALPAGSPVVAITGSSGKTSTKEMVRAMLATKWRVHATSGNLNNLIGVPLTLLDAPPETDALVIEAGASIPGEIARLRAIIEPTIAIVTNVSYAHVAGFGSLAGVMREKLTLAAGTPLAVVGTEPPELAAGARRITRTLVAGADTTADVHPESVTLDDGGHAMIRWAGAAGTLSVVGEHQVENAMLALAVARETGVDPAQALGALAQVRLPPGRGSVLEVRGLTVIDDTYNANPSSLHWALRFAHWLARRRGRPLAVVVGSMLELGGESARLHAAAAREIVALEPALVGAVGEFVPAFAALAGELGPRLIATPDAAALGPRLRAALRGDEVVLLKASRGVALERVLSHLT